MNFNKYYTKVNKAKCFISFDYDNDKSLKDLLIGQSIYVVDNYDDSMA